ncbi:MAG TPA: hypothetical protein VJL34_14270 [Anaerolineales bacterium]|nr:hypothetical protein [Anaerolineales bacterium]
MSTKPGLRQVGNPPGGEFWVFCGRDLYFDYGANAPPLSTLVSHFDFRFDKLSVRSV